MMSAGGGGGKNIEADGDEKFVQVLDIHQPSRGLTAWPPITQMPIANGYTTHKGLPFPSLHSQFLTYNNNTQPDRVCVCVLRHWWLSYNSRPVQPLYPNRVGS
jgi:hypothetical protein